MSKQIQEFICVLLLKKGPLPENEDLDSYRYLDKGHIDSLALVKFIFEIEDEYNIEFSPEDSQSDEFRTLGGLVRLIQQKLDE